MKRRGMKKRGLSLALTMAMLLGILPISESPVKAKAAENTAYAMNIGADNLKVSDGAKWDKETGKKVYFGKYDEEPMLFRILAKSEETQSSSDGSILLDCDGLIEELDWDQENNEWQSSDLREWLNSEEFYGNTSVFSETEKNAISATNLFEMDPYDLYDLSGTSMYYFDQATTDHVFFLSKKEADNLYGSAAARIKTESKEANEYGFQWWLRTGTQGGAFIATISNKNGNIVQNVVLINDGMQQVSPALNIKTSGILFTSTLDVQKYSEIKKDSQDISEISCAENGSWKLTMKAQGDNLKVIEIPSDEEIITKLGMNIIVPYTYTDASEDPNEQVNQISVMITDKAYGSDEAKIMYYGALQDIKDEDGESETVANATTGTGSFVLPEALREKTIGTDYHIYLLAEHVNRDSAVDYASEPVELKEFPEEPVAVHSCEFEVDQPLATRSFKPYAYYTYGDVRNRGVEIEWTKIDGTPVEEVADFYPMQYDAHILLNVEEGYGFAEDLTVTCTSKGVKSVNVKYISDEQVEITVRTVVAKTKFYGAMNPSDITDVPNGTLKTAEALGLPEEVEIVAESSRFRYAKVEWDLEHLISGSYDPDVLTEQKFTVQGTITLDEGLELSDEINIEEGDRPFDTFIDVTVCAAENVKKPEIEGETGTFTRDQFVNLTCKTPGASIYYTLDGSTPSPTNGILYEEPFEIIGCEGESKEYVIKAIAIKEKMQDSEVAEFTFCIEVPVPTYKVTVINGTGSGLFEGGKSVTVTAKSKIDGKKFVYWKLSEELEIIQGDIKSETLTFRMPEKAITLEAIYEVEDEPKDEPKDEVKDEPKDEVKDEPKDEVKDEPKDEPEDEVKDGPKDESKDEVKDEPKNEPKDESKDHSENIPKEEVKDDLETDKVDQAVNTGDFGVDLMCKLFVVSGILIMACVMRRRKTCDR